MLKVLPVSSNELAQQKFLLSSRFDRLDIEGRVKVVDLHFEMSPIDVTIVADDNRTAIELWSVNVRHLIKVWMR